MSTIVKRHRPAYELTVRSFIARFIKEYDEDDVAVYEKDGSDELINLMDIIKSLGLSPDVSKSKIHASGLVYDVAAGVKGATVSLGVVALPRVFLDKAIGSKVMGALSYDKTMAAGQEFGCGYVCDQSDGSQVYYWHPRCKLVVSDEDHDTSDDSDIDPEESYDIEIMPTSEGVYKVRYYTADVSEEKEPLTLAEFFGSELYSIAQIEALPAKEQLKAGG